METTKHDRTINLRLTVEQFTALSREALADERPVGQYIRHLLVRHLGADDRASRPAAA